MSVGFVSRIVLLGMLGTGDMLAASEASVPKATTGSGNRVVNPSFEESGNKKLTGWTPQFRSANAEDRAKYINDATFVISNKAYSGAKCAGISATALSPAKGYACWIQEVAVKAETTYQLSVMVRKEGQGWANAALMPRSINRENDGKGISVTAPPESLTQYAEIETRITTGPNTRFLIVELRAQLGTMTVWFDDVSLVEIPGEDAKP